VGRPCADGPPRLILTSDIDGPEFLDDPAHRELRERYLAACEGRVRELVVYLTTRTARGESPADLGERVARLIEQGERRRVRIRVESHGAAHVRFDGLRLSEQIDNVRASVRDLRAAGVRPREFRAPHLSHDRRTPHACRRAGLEGPIGTNLATDYALLETLDLDLDAGRRRIEESCEREVEAGRDLVVLFHADRMADPRAGPFLEAYLDAAERLL
jgi:peptidoglycan/xylan/chitin deacetylase (PgdA/CDA1 family)